MAHAAVHAAAMAHALKASGALVRVEPQEFQKILSRQEEPLVVRAAGGLFKSKFQYLTSFKGLVFYTRSSEEIMLSGRALLVAADSIWIPG
jgi:hypothetical protein